MMIPTIALRSFLYHNLFITSQHVTEQLSALWSQAPAQPQRREKLIDEVLDRSLYLGLDVGEKCGGKSTPR